MPFACIFVPDFPVEALLRTEPELRTQALAVLEGKAPLQKVFSINENARRARVSVGMTKMQVEACTEIVLKARAPLQEASAHAALLDCAQSFSPRVEDSGPDVIVIDLEGMESLLGPPPKIARAIAQQASQLGLEANVALAGNPDTAQMAARGFAGVTVIAQGKEAEQLGSLPIEVLLAHLPPEVDIGPVLETFHRWGVRTLQEFAALPEIDLSERMGQTGVYWQKLARGASSRTLAPLDAPLVFEEAIELEHPVLLLEPLAFFLSRLLEQICSRLAARALATQELRLELELENGHEEIYWKDVGAGMRTRAARQKFQRTLRLPVPVLDAKTFLKLLQLDLRAHPPGAPIVKIHLRAEPMRPRAAQNGLFLPPSPEPERLEITIARIAAIVGEDKVGSIEMLDTHRPGGFCMRRFGHGVSKESSRTIARSGETKTHTSSARQSYPSQDDLVTALRQFRPPVAVSVVLDDGKPARISSKRREIEGQILWAAGPWRSSGDWWENEGWARDEWDIAVPGEGGIAMYRLVRDLLSGKWMVEGTYD